MDAMAVVYDLTNMGIISDGNQKEVGIASDRREKNQILHGHLKRTCTMTALMDVCDVICAVSGNPRMKDFGIAMRSKLQAE